MKIMLDLYPGGKPKCLTMSYDDGSADDRRLVSIFDKYGIRGTFHLNSGNLDHGGRLTSAELPELFKNHEISCHSVTHPFLERIPRDEAVAEILNDRRNLEAACGYVVRGMSYPYGSYTEELIKNLRSVGMEYSRTTRSTGCFGLPEDFMKWHPTTHHSGGVLEKLEEFEKLPRPYLSLFYVWGHSFEFARNDNWDLIERFCEKAANHDDVWYATNIEIVDYIAALKALRFSADSATVYNPSAVVCYISVDGQAVKIPAGETVKLG